MSRRWSDFSRPHKHCTLGDFAAILIAALVLTVFSVCIMVLILGRSARAHDHWISHERLIDPVTGQWCCDERDTAEETANVRKVDGGYLIISTGEVIANARIIWRSPGGWWRSRNLADGSTRCLIGPMPGS